MDRHYNLNEIAMMTGFSTKTLRSYLSQGLLKGEKMNGAWQFSAEEVNRFFADPFVKEGLRIKRSGIVFDFLADRTKKRNAPASSLTFPLHSRSTERFPTFFARRWNPFPTLFSHLIGTTDTRESFSPAHRKRWRTS